MGGSLRIGIDWREFVQGKHTGIQSYLASFLTYARELRPSWSFVLFGDGATAFSPWAGAERVETVRMGERVGVWWDHVHLSVACRRQEVDVFLTPYVKAPAFAPCPVVVWFNDVSPLKLGRALASGSRTYFRLMCWLMLWKASKIICISEAARKDVERMFPIGHGKLVTVPLGVRPSLLDGGGGPPRPLRALGLDGPYVLHVSDLRPHKDVWTLLRAYARLDVKVRRVYRLAVVGRRENLRPPPDDWLAENGLEERVVFLGQVEDRTLAALYRGARAFVFPSRHEGFGLPVLEAMSAGVPVAVSDVSSLPEVAGDAGILFPPGDDAALAQILEPLLSDGGLHDRQAERARRRARAYDPRTMTAEVVRIVEEVVN